MSAISHTELRGVKRPVTNSYRLWIQVRPAFRAEEESVDYSSGLGVEEGSGCFACSLSNETFVSVNDCVCTWLTTFLTVICIQKCLKALVGHWDLWGITVKNKLDQQPGWVNCRTHRRGWALHSRKITCWNHLTFSWSLQSLPVDGQPFTEIRVPCFLILFILL